MLRASGTTDLAHGYRLPNIARQLRALERREPAPDKHFLDLTSAGGVSAFTPDSSRCLNCPSNLIGHDHPNKPANGVGK